MVDGGRTSVPDPLGWPSRVVLHELDIAIGKRIVSTETALYGTL